MTSGRAPFGNLEAQVGILALIAADLFSHTPLCSVLRGRMWLTTLMRRHTARWELCSVAEIHD